MQSRILCAAPFDCPPELERTLKRIGVGEHGDPGRDPALLVQAEHFTELVEGGIFIVFHFLCIGSGEKTAQIAFINDPFEDGRIFQTAVVCHRCHTFHIFQIFKTFILHFSIKDVGAEGQSNIRFFVQKENVAFQDNALLFGIALRVVDSRRAAETENIFIKDTQFYSVSEEGLDQIRGLI